MPRVPYITHSACTNLGIAVPLCFHEIEGRGVPSASQTMVILEPSATSVSDGSTIILGGTETKAKQNLCSAIYGI